VPREDEMTLAPKEMFKSYLRVNSLLNSALGLGERMPEDLGPDELEAWKAAFLAGITFMEKHEHEQMEFGGIAAAANAAWQAVAGEGPAVPWDEIAPLYQEKWKFLARHQANLLGYDGEDDGSVQKHEDQIVAMFGARIKELTPAPPPQPAAPEDGVQERKDLFDALRSAPLV
jgi:hypothetical protein